MNIIEVLEQEQLRSDIPDFRAGDTVKVYVKVVEGTRERVQMYEGVVIARSYRDAPEVDGLVYVEAQELLVPGDIETVKITGCDDYDLFGVVV